MNYSGEKFELVFSFVVYYDLTYHVYQLYSFGSDAERIFIWFCGEWDLLIDDGVIFGYLNCDFIVLGVENCIFWIGYFVFVNFLDFSKIF